MRWLFRVVVATLLPVIGLPVIGLATLQASPPLICPAGAPIGTFRITVTRPSGGAGLQLQSINEVPPGYKVSYQPVNLNSMDKKKARIALVIVPSDHGRIVVLDPKPASQDAEWTTPVEAQIVSLVYGPQGLDKGKIGDLVKKNDELIGQLADYAQKTQETQALIQAITQQQQALDTGQNVNAAVVSFAGQFSGAGRIDRTQPVDQQMLESIRGVNPALAAYDPLAQNPAQQAAQTAGLAAAVARLFFGTNVGLAASGGALLVNMHSLLFPGTEFRSAFALAPPDHKDQTALCGNKTAPSRTELAFLWATRIPDASAPELAIEKPVHLPIGGKATFPLTVKARDWALAARVQDWKLVSSDGKISVPVGAKVNTAAKTIEIDAADKKLTPGTWKLSGNWDWMPIGVGEIDVRKFSSFEHASLSPASHDRLTGSSGKSLVTLQGDDFEFVDKLAYKYCGDPFAQAETLPFHLPKGPAAGPQATLETQLAPKSLEAGKYLFLITQSDGKTHEVPFTVLPPAPQISNLPLLVNPDDDWETVTLRGSGLDRIESLSSDDAEFIPGASGPGESREVQVKLKTGASKGAYLAIRMKVKDFEQPIILADAILVAGPRPEIQSFRLSVPPDLGIALQPEELPGHSYVSFDLDIANVDASAVKGVRLACKGSAATTDLKLHPAPNGPIFLSFDPATVGQAGCSIMASVVTAESGQSKPKKLGTVVLLPKISAFRLTGDRADGNAFYGELKGQGLEGIERVGWDAITGTPVQEIPTPVADSASQQILRVALPWPPPAPHSPLFIWLRREPTGRATTARW